MATSIQRRGSIDWDFVRDLDWRVYLPPQIGHESGFLTYFQTALDRELRRWGLATVSRGKDPDGRPQVQIRDLKSGEVHGFHLYLLSMDPGFVLRSIHEGGGYTTHQTYFPEDAVDHYLEADPTSWEALLQRQREHYEQLFQRVSFNTFGGNDPASEQLKTRGWYSRKAFKWYASLAAQRGLTDLQQELLDHYDNFAGDHGDLVHMVRRHYFARLDPQSAEIEWLERELGFALSLAYARGRSPKPDLLTGQQTPDAGEKDVILEPVPGEWLQQAISLLSGNTLTSEPARPDILRSLNILATSGLIRFADGVAKPGVHTLAGGNAGILLPSVWAFVFTESYTRHAASAVRRIGRPCDASGIRDALNALLAFFLIEALPAT